MYKYCLVVSILIHMAIFNLGGPAVAPAAPGGDVYYLQVLTIGKDDRLRGKTEGGALYEQVPSRGPGKKQLSEDVEQSTTAPAMPTGDTGCGSEENKQRADDIQAPVPGDCGMAADTENHFEKPVRIFDIAPEYPAEARLRGWEGTVVLMVEVLSNGAVGRVEVTSSSGYEALDQEALKTIKMWRYQPALKNGVAVDCLVRVKIIFKLEDEKMAKGCENR